MKRRIIGLAALALLVLSVQQAAAAVPLASADADRRAKQAIPPTGKALVYVYRLDDHGPAQSSTIWFNGYEFAGLAPRTFIYWAVAPGRVNLRSGSSGSTVTLRCEQGRIYFVKMTVAASGRADLRTMSYSAGRRDTNQAHLVRDVQAIKRPAPSAKPSKPAKQPKQAKQPSKPAEPSSKQLGVTLILKVGSFQLGDKSQTILGAPLDFSSTATSWGLEGEWRIPSDYAFGLELGSRSHSYSSVVPGASGHMEVTSVFINAKKYFRATPIVQPYVGAGLGSVSTKFSGGVSGSASDIAEQIMGGVAFRWQRFGVYTELKYQNAKTSGKDALTGASVPVDASGIGLFAGVDVHF
jgi:opacity protein-like surface antigen